MQQSDLNGILLMNKPQGFTSHDVVAKLRGILHTRRIGHGGTLDPMATGVLPVFVGGATKAADFAAAQDKEYVAGFTLGYCTDTQDVTGEMLQTSERYAAEYAVKQMVRRFVGPQQQVPPMYSGGQGERPEAVRSGPQAGKSSVRHAISWCTKWTCSTSMRMPRRARCGVRSARAPTSAHWSMILAKSWARWPCCTVWSAPVRRV
mgnify:CR=1 FL=1